MSQADHFRIGSNTKTFVVAVILQLVDEGKLSLDDPLSKFSLGVKVPESTEHYCSRTLRYAQRFVRSLRCAGGAKINVKPDSIWDPRKIIAWGVKQKPYFPPGAGYHYTRTNYLLLGLIIEAITKDTVGNQIRTRVITPFGLTGTSYPATMSMPDPWAHGYGLDKHRNWKTSATRCR